MNVNELSDGTDPEKAENEEYRNFKEEPVDDDGENRNPTKRNYQKLILHHLCLLNNSQIWL